MSDYITQDLLILILKRLPVKTILRCRCVSKSWKQLIASKSFILDHLSVQPHRIVVQNGDLRYHLLDPQTLPEHIDSLEAPIREITSLDRNRHGFTLSSVHGVNCVYNNAHILLLFNPSTRQLLNIPPPPESPSSRSDTDFNYCGFWIDPSTNNFKVVIFCLETRNALLFSSEGNVWTDVDMGAISDLNGDSDSPQVMIDGVAHWTAFNVSGREAGDLVSFDFEQSKFGIIELAPLNPSTIYLYLCKWKDVLSVVHWDFPLDNVCQLWMMQNGSWCKMFSFGLPEDTMSVYCVLESSGKVIAATEEDYLLLYDPEEGFVPLNTDTRMFGFSFSYDFVESLVFPDRNGLSSD